MKKSLIYFSALILGVTASTALTSCDNDWEYPPMVVPEATIEANTTIADLKTEFFQAGQSNYATLVGTKQDGSHYIIEGYVSTSDESGNYFKQLVIQDETSAIQLDVDAYDLYLSYQMGQKIVLDVTGLYIGGYGGLLQIGAAPTSGYPSRIAEDKFAECAQRDGLSNESTMVQPLTVTMGTLNSINPTSVDGLNLQNRLIKIEGVTFQNAGKATLSTSGSNGVSQTFSNSEGSAILYTSGYSDFWNYYCPTGTGNIVGILSSYRDTWQIRLIDIDGLQGFDELTQAPSGGGGGGNTDVPDVADGTGTAESPYSVTQAITMIKSGSIPSGDVCVAGYVTEITDLSTDYGNATYTIADSKSPEGLVVYRGKYLNGTSFTSANQLQVGAKVVVKGVLTYYNSTTPEINSGSQIISYTDPNGNTVGGDNTGGGGDDTGGDVGGAGSQTNPYNVAAVMAGATGNEVWVKGYIVGWVEGQVLADGAHFDATNVSVASNILISDKPNATSLADAVPVQLPAGTVRAALNLQNNPGNLGKEVLIKGDLDKYFGTAGVKSVTDFVLDGQGSNDGNGDGTVEKYTVAQALSMINSGNYSATTTVQVEGYITSIEEVSTQYGNATYVISDSKTDTTGLTIFRGYYLDGAKFTSADQIKVGAKVIVEGTLTLYNNTKPEMNTGNKIVSYVAP